MRYVDMLNEQSADRMPYFLRDFTLGMDVLGIRTDEIFSDVFNSKLSADSICAFQKFTGQDAVIGCTHSPAFIIEQFGGKMRYPKDNVPVPITRPLSGIRDFSSIDTEFKGKILSAFESYSIVKKRMKGIADVVGNITGPFTKAGVLAGIEELTMMLNSDKDAAENYLQFCCDFTIKTVEHLAKNSLVDSFIIAAATDNPDMFGFDIYEKFSVKFTEKICKKIHDLGFTVAYHPHGTFVSNMTDYSESILKMQIDGFHFSENNDPVLLSKIFGKKMCIMGGTDIVHSLMVSAEKTESDTRKYIDTFKENPYVFMASCSLHRGVPLENVKVMCNSLHP